MRKRLLLLLILLLGIHVTNPAFGEDAPHGFFLGPSGQFSIDPNETIEGRRSVVGKYQGADSYNQFLITDPNVFPLRPGKTYTVRFKYKILATPDKGFEVLFYSPKGAAANVWLPSKHLREKPTTGENLPHEHPWTL